MSRDRKNGNQDSQDPFKSLPEDITKRVLPAYLPPESMGILPRVAHYWHALFSSDDSLRTNLLSQLGVGSDVLLQLEALRGGRKISFDFKTLFTAYYRLIKVIEKKNLHIPRIPTDAVSRFVMLASCVNNASIWQWIPREWRYDFHFWTIVAGTTCFDQAYIETLEPLLIERLWRTVINFGTSEQLLALLPLEKNGIPIFPLRGDDLQEAIFFGSEEMALTLLSLRDENGKQLISPGKYAPKGAAARGSLKLLRFMLKLEDDRGNPLIVPDEAILNAAAGSNNVEVFRELLVRNILPSLHTLHVITQSGDRDMLLELFKVKDEHQVPWILTITTRSAIEMIARSENRELVFLYLEFAIGFSVGEEKAQLQKTYEQYKKEEKRLNDEETAKGRTIQAAIIACDLNAFNARLASPTMVDRYTLHEVPTKVDHDMLEDAILYSRVEIIENLLELKEGVHPIIRLIPSDIQLAARRGDAAIFEFVFARWLKRKSPPPLSWPDIVFEALRSGNAALFHKVLTYLNESGEKFVPTYRELTLAMGDSKTGNFAIAEELLLYKNEKGEPMLESDRLTYDAKHQSQYSTNLFFFYIAQSHNAMQKAIKIIVQGNDFDAATGFLQEAYQHSPQHFFKEIDYLLQHPTPYKPDMLKQLRDFVENLILAELQNPALPLCELETLRTQQAKFISNTPKIR